MSMARTLRNFILLGITMVIVLVLAASAAMAQTNAQRRAQLEAELDQLEDEIEQQEKILEQQKDTTGALSAEVKKLASDIKKKKQLIRSKTITINNLSEEIEEREEIIADLTSQEDRQRASLAQLLRNVQRVESYSLLEVMLSDNNISNFFVDVDTTAALKASLNHSLEGLRDTKQQRKEEKENLEEKKEQEQDTKAELDQEKRRVENKEKDQKILLDESKDKEKSYEQLIKQRKAEAAKIRAALFELVGVKDGGIPFGDALEIAKTASDLTGIDPAFLLAILQQETGIGKNVGTCNRPGDTRTWRDIMPGPNDNSWRDDQTNFLIITKELGISPDGVPLSCPIGGYGWGGAMGPSQFIPTTWLQFKDRVASLLGKSVANPWIPTDAFTASALYLSELGASARSYNAERNAACKYYSGRVCSDPNVKNAFYGNGVMNKKIEMQRRIDVIETANG